jgi:hypothetical protein
MSRAPREGVNDHAQQEPKRPGKNYVQNREKHLSAMREALHPTTVKIVATKPDLDTHDSVGLIG